MSRTPQDIYASNLLRRQSFGYPLRNPRPKDRFSSLEGFRIGDVGHIDENGEFNVLFNITSPPETLQNLLAPGFDLAQPPAKPAFNAGKIFMAGVKRKLRPRAESELRVDYAFTTTEKDGAILILPDGAILSELEDKGQLERIREHVARCALQWCRFANKDSLYLLTAVYKSKSWTLGSFYDAPNENEIVVYRACDSAGASTYKWEYESNVDDQQGPNNNSYHNQTVLIKGFKMTVRWDWLPIVERVERTEWWFVCFLTSLWSTISWRWLSRIRADNILTRNFSQPHHPLDTINHVLLDKHSRAQVAVTHDDDWIEMLDRGLSPEYLMHEVRLREFVMKEQIWDLDSEKNVVYLRNKFEDVNGEHEPPQDSSSFSRSDESRFAIINMRLESVDIDHVYTGVCVLVQFGSTTKKTMNKTHAKIVEWDDEVVLPGTSSQSVDVTVCGAFQLGSTLGTREIFAKQTINTKDLSGDTHLIRLPMGQAGPGSSLLITLGRYFSCFGAHSIQEERSNFMEKTDLGFEAFYSYWDDPKEEYLERALESFQHALRQSGFDLTCRSTALFNLATSQFIRCRAYGTYSKLDEPIKLYEEALQSRGPGHPDRPATLLLLAQALLSRLGHEYDESIAAQIEGLLTAIPPDGSRDRRTADTIIRTCRLYRLANARDPTEVDNSLFGDLDPGIYSPPYGYFDRPNILHKLAVAAWVCFQLYANVGDLDRSIELSKEALCLIPDGHDDQGIIVACLGRSYLRLIEAREDLMDVDMSADFVELGKRVVTALGNISIELAGVSSKKEELCEQIKLMLAADDAIRFIAQEVSSPRIPVVQSLIDEWSKEDGISTRCKRELGVLLSFLEGEGEAKMHELLANLDWPYKEYKTKETTQILQNHTRLFLEGSFPTKFGIKLESTMLTHDSTSDPSVATTKFPKYDLCRAICDVLEENGRVKEASACFRRMSNNPAEHTSLLPQGKRARWELDFRCRCMKGLEKLGDNEIAAKHYNEAAELFSTILSLKPEYPVGILFKRGQARASMGLWDGALSDVDVAIKLIPLRGWDCHAEVIETFGAILLMLEGSPDEDVREHRRRYVDARPTIQRIVENTIRPMPQVLIDTETGRLQNKQQQADAFKALPIYSELVLSMTTELDEKRIQEAVKTFYRYVMLSHKWEIGEPLLQQVENISIYEGLEASPANVKLRKFCMLVRYFHLRWAWSDTCCIDKLDKDVLQESLVAMFSWYRGSFLTVVYLLDVSSELRVPGALQRSIWNTRAWTYQEYVAAEIILFYTRDWKPYLGLTLSNHKESPEVISEMQQATGVSAQEMAVLRPGLDRVREKLYLASMRQAFRVEDTAYSLFGIFNVAIQVNYGEGDRAVGRLLDHILTGSGDVTVLAWTGTSGDHNSCLPRDLTVYNLLAPPHIPRPIEKAEIDNIITGLRSSLPNLSTVMTLYKRLQDLPSPSVTACRLKLPGIICSITNLVRTVEPLSEANPLHTYRATTTIFGNVEIKTAETLPGMKALRLVHPWIRALLDQEHLVGAGAPDESTQALRFVARLRQPFGALLFERKSRVEYKRVAADCLIMAQVGENISLDGLIGGIGVIEAH